MTQDKKVIIALDAMGGDLAPAETVKGAVEAANADPLLVVQLFGDEEKVRKELEAYTFRKEQIEIVPTTQVVAMSESPTAAIRKKKDSSMVRGLYAVRKGEADAFVSCGNTGALLVGGQVIVGKIPGVERPALAFIVPTLKGPCMIIDCGASVDARPEMLLQFAQMASLYMREIVGIKDPRVGIVNIGEEEEKGNEQVKATVPLLKACGDIRFIGSIESRGITAGAADIAVCDAFVGNIILKMYEGVAASLLKEIKGALMSDFKTKVGALLIKKSLKKTLKKFSIEEYGGAPMLGLKHLVMKTHGNSKAPEIRNTLLQCASFVREDVTGKIAEDIMARTSSAPAEEA